MAKSKADLLKEAQSAGLVAAGADAEDFTAADLERMLNPGNAPAWEGSLSSPVPIIAPDGHVNLSQEDIDART